MAEDSINIDDVSIADEDRLLRRVPNWPNMTKFDPRIGAIRVTSACFSDVGTNDREVSMTLEKDLLNSGGRHEDAIALHPGFGLASLGVEVVRNDLPTKQIIVRNPQPDDPYHCLVIGDKGKAEKRMMAKKSELIIEPNVE